MKQKKYPMVHLGTASILTILVILAIITFATLSYMSVRKDANYTRQTLTASIEYQTAVNKAYEKIADIDTALYNSYQSGTYHLELEKEYSFSIPISTDSKLQVILVPCLPSENNGSFYQITSFKEVQNTQWKNDSTLQLLQ